MNPEQLLQHFDRISEAPDAIPRLRRFILDLAVRGKLVEQDPNDEPAAELLTRILVKKASLNLKEKAKAGTQKLGLQKNERLLLLPSNWTYAKLSELTSVLNGRAYSKNELLDQGTPVLRVGNLFTSEHWYYSNLTLDEDKYCDQGDLIFAWSASFGPFIWQGPKVIYHYHIWKLDFYSQEDLDKYYLYRFLQHKTQAIKDAGHGVSMLHMTKEKMEKLLVPLPPLAEQHRIVAKVDELMALCDQLQAAQTEREQSRDRLVAASLHSLNPPADDVVANTPEIQREHARFLFNHLPRLTTRPTHIKQLRQTILNLAVRGKLVQQDPNDEPAVELLKRIQAEKTRLLNTGGAKKQKSRVQLITDELPFPVPKSWQWSQLAAIGFISPRNDAEGATLASFVPMTLIPAEYGVPHKHEVRSWNEFKTGYTHFAEGDVGLAKITPCFENGKSTVFRGLTGGFGAGTTELHIVRPLLVNADYVLLFLKSPYFIETGIPRMTGTAGQKRVSADYFAYSPFPLPPLAEQHRIVAKVDELMALCDQLETQLADTATDSRRLLEAVLHDALLPADVAA